MTIRVVIADDHRVVRDGLGYLLGQEPDIEVAGEAGDGRRTLDVVAAVRPDVLLLRMTIRLNGFSSADRQQFMHALQPYLDRPQVQVEGPFEEASAGGLWWPRQRS